MKAPYLIGNRIYLRPLEREDAPRFVEWVNDPDITRTIVHRPPINLAAEVDYIDKITRDDNALTLGIALRADDRLIGATGFHLIDWRNRQASFGILLDKAEWGKGYGTQATVLLVKHAFETLNLNRVWLHAYAYNQRGLRAYEKAGFQREGVLRQENFREGRYWDTVVMAVLRDEWRPS